MDQEELYRKNLELFARDNPVEAFRMEKSPSLELCITSQNELNLTGKIEGRTVYWHAQEGAVLESQYWVKMLPLDSCDVIFVYGLGLGYYYLALKNWLAESSQRYVVFLEDEAAVMNPFLHTALATEMLENPQVVVKFLPHFEQTEQGWAELRVVAVDLFGAFALLRPHISALQMYLTAKLPYFKAFAAQWSMALSRAARSLVEFYPFPEFVFHNFYANLFYLGETISGYKLAGAMRSFPAVLCGAGPSLVKQFPYLKQLADQVLLMASGSAMNALTHAGIMPHVAGAIDPTPAQASRQLTSFGFEVPAFYQNRFFDKAFTQWHGNLLYMVGSGSNRLSEWFEKELGIKDAEQIIMGVSTSNFLLEIANFLGCNPIVLVGMDLAYSDDVRYAKGVSVHPADDKNQHNALTEKQEGLIPVPGVSGKDVYITDQWFYEAVCMAAFKQRNPEVVFLNATEGGMIIPLVPNIAFHDAIEDYFNQPWDIQGWFHGVVQNASEARISKDKIQQTIEKWKKSLKACENHLIQLIESFQQDLLHPQSSRPLYHGKALFWQHELYHEAAYEFFFEAINTVFSTINTLRIRKLKWMKDLQEKFLEEIAIEIDRYQFLLDNVRNHLKAMHEGEIAFKHRQSALSKTIAQKEQLKAPVAPVEYRIEEGKIFIHEPALGVDLKAIFSPQLIPKSSWPKIEQTPFVEALVGKVNGEREGQTLYFYPDGKVKAEAFYHAGRLHGPWTFYSPTGVVLYRSWFIEGEKQGRSCAYYLNGALYSLCGYRNGQLQGEQLYYYPDGILKTKEHYQEGLLEGVVQLFYVNGRLKKEQHFAKGELHGQERMWDELGVLMIEASYEYGKVVGVSKKWHANGQLARRVVHGKDGGNVQSEEWDEKGQSIKR